eukprot:1152168-Pelagomonas_calceolata.AAC.1
MNGGGAALTPNSLTYSSTQGAAAEASEELQLMAEGAARVGASPTDTTLVIALTTVATLEFCDASYRVQVYVQPSIGPHNAAHAPKRREFLTDMGCTEAEGVGAAQLAGGGNWEHACMGEAGQTS